MNGLCPSERTLRCGPPGCGKTLTAEVIASELGRPFAAVRTDSVVSFLGETAANLRKVFDFAATTPMVMLFEEFDALGKEREDASEHGELRGVRRDFDVEEIAERDMFKGATHADVERSVRRALKEMIIRGGEPRLNVDHLETARRRESARRQRATRR